jgi:hypothetical protein
MTYAPASPNPHTIEVRVYLARIRPQHLIVPATVSLLISLKPSLNWRANSFRLPSRWVKTPGPPSRGRVAPPISDNSSGEIFSSIHMLLDADAARAFLAESSRQSQQHLAQSLFTVNRHQVGDDLLLVSYPHRQVLHKAFKQRVTA